MSTYHSLLKNRSLVSLKDEQEFVEAMKILEADTFFSNVVENIIRDCFVSQESLLVVLNLIRRFHLLGISFSKSNFRRELTATCRNINKSFIDSDIFYSDPIDSTSITIIGRVVTKSEFTLYSGARKSSTDLFLKNMRYKFLHRLPLGHHEVAGTTFSRPDSIVWATWSETTEDPFDFVLYYGNSSYKYAAIKASLGLMHDDNIDVLLLRYQLPKSFVGSYLWYPTVVDACLYERFQPVGEGVDGVIPKFGRTRNRNKDELKAMIAKYGNPRFFESLQISRKPEAVHKGSVAFLEYCLDVTAKYPPQTVKPTE